MGLQQTPPTQIIVSLALILTILLWNLMGKNLGKKGIKPYMDEKIGYEIAKLKSIKPFKEFMIKNTRESDLALFYRIKKPNPKNIDDVPLTLF